MTDPGQPPPPTEPQDRWDGAELMRRRAAATRAARDDAIKELRRSMTESEIRDEFGIDLGEIET